MLRQRLMPKGEQEGMTDDLSAFGQRRLVFVIAMWSWKEVSFPAFLDGADIIFFDDSNCQLETVTAALRQQRPDEVIFWGMMEPEGLAAHCQQLGIQTRRVEDGFLRSVGLTGARPQPLSLCFDSRGIYFNPQAPSDLEHLLLTHDFERDAALLARAEAGIARMLDLNVSKYNHAPPADVSALYGPKDRPRILVLGQVEDDQSIRYGCEGSFHNNDLVRLAAAEHPDAQIIYKPHPDVLSGHREKLSDPEAVSEIATVVSDPLSIGDAFQTVDHVYTATSLAGFEALLRGIRVTTWGRPFYAGWGLTDDRQPPLRARRNLPVEALFAAAYILYPTYRHPQTGKPMSFEQALDFLAAERDAGLST
jgi:capsular polysaccharide export protein